MCDVDPGHPVSVTVEADLRALTQWWRGDLSWDAAVRSERVRLHGAAANRRAVPRWFHRSVFAGVPRP